MAGRDLFGMPKSPPAAAAAPPQSVRMAYTSDGTPVFAPVSAAVSAPPGYQPVAPPVQWRGGAGGLRRGARGQEEARAAEEVRPRRVHVAGVGDLADGRRVDAGGAGRPRAVLADAAEAAGELLVVGVAGRGEEAWPAQGFYQQAAHRRRR